MKITIKTNSEDLLGNVNVDMTLPIKSHLNNGLKSRLGRPYVTAKKTFTEESINYQFSIEKAMILYLIENIVSSQGCKAAYQIEFEQ